MKLCSACLLGIKCRYDGRFTKYDEILELSKKEILIPVCPEQLGGLSTPRAGAELINGEGLDVLEGKAKVMTLNKVDVTKEFIRGAEEVLKIAQLLNITEAILKQKSPSCGCGKIYGGSISKKYKKGDGVTAALLKKNGIKITTEEDYEDSLKRSLKELIEQQKEDKKLNVKREVKKELTKLKNQNKKESKKCVMCKEKGIYHIKDSLDFYCKDCAIEFFGSLDCLKKNK